MSIDDIDHGLAMQQAAERHINLVWAAFYQAEDDEDGEDIVSPAVGPFCGCTTCEVRETLAGAWPAIETYFAMQASNPMRGHPVE
jgi:hypothetical protein